VKPNSRGLRAKSLFPKKILETDSSLLNALEEGSEVLQNITDQCATLMPRFRIFFSWEQERTTLPYSKAYIVDETSAAPIIDRTERSNIAADYRGICKFESRNLPGFRTVVAVLRRYRREAPETIKARSARASVMLGNQRWHEATELVKGLPKEPGWATVSWPQQDEPRGATGSAAWRLIQWHTPKSRDGPAPRREPIC